MYMMFSLDMLKRLNNLLLNVFDIPALFVFLFSCNGKNKIRRKLVLKMKTAGGIHSVFCRTVVLSVC